LKKVNFLNSPVAAVFVQNEKSKTIFYLSAENKITIYWDCPITTMGVFLPSENRSNLVSIKISFVNS
jgi:hypothetical protein